MSGYRPGEQRHHRRLATLSLMVVLTVLLALSISGVARASTADIEQATAEARELISLIDQMNRELEAATEDYNYARQQLEDTKIAATNASKNLKRAAHDLENCQYQFNERVVLIYKQGNYGALDIIMGSYDFSDLVTRLEKLRWLSARDSELLEQIQAFRGEESDLKVQLETQLEQQKAYEAEAAAAQQRVEDKLAQQREALKGKEAEIAKLRKAEEERQARLAAEARARKAFLASRPGRVVSMAMDYLGVPYVWGGSSPRGFDCSGLVQYVFAKVGVSLPHSSRMQFSYGRPVSRSQLRVGDLVFFFSPIQHVGIYIGNGRMVNATGNQVQISDVWPSSFRGGRRIF